jgi:ethanolamine permease
MSSKCGDFRQKVVSWKESFWEWNSAYGVDERTGTDGNGVHLGKYDAFFFGIALISGGTHIAWSHVAEEGFGLVIIATAVVGLAFHSLCMCNGELTSALPFGGGSYGVVRLVEAKAIGYLNGIWTIMQSVILTGFQIYNFGKIFKSATGMPGDAVPVVWFLVYISIIAINTIGCKFYWRSVIFSCFWTFLILSIYFFGSLDGANFSKYAESADTSLFEGGIAGFLRILPWVIELFMGIELVNLTTDECSMPRQSVPFGMIWSMRVWFVVVLVIIVVAASNGPGIDELFETRTPLAYGEYHDSCPFVLHLIHAQLYHT